jgi:hypothetical protein
MESTDIFAGIVFPRAGFYAYKITEIPDTYGITNPDRESMQYSNAEYLVTAIVEDNAGSPVLKHIVTSITIKDSETQTQGKVQVEVGGGVDYEYSQMIFTNTYVMTRTSEALTIYKSVEGDYGDRSMQFDFSVLLTTNSLAPLAPNYSATIVRMDGSREALPITAGTAASFKLADGDYLALENLPVGTLFSASETAHQDYSTAILLMLNGGTGLRVDGLETGTHPIIASENSATFINTFDLTPPTGFNLALLPFVLIMGVGLGILVVTTVIRTRRKSYDF